MPCYDTSRYVDDPQGVLGRDVLASVALVFDGPAQEWAELARA